MSGQPDDDLEMEFTHKTEDYAALDRKGLDPEMVADILQRSQLGQPLTSEQCAALGMSSRLNNMVLLPKDGAKTTRYQLYALFGDGSKEEFERRQRWFIRELIRLAQERDDD